MRANMRVMASSKAWMFREVVWHLTLAFVIFTSFLGGGDGKGRGSCWASLGGKALQTAPSHINISAMRATLRVSAIPEWRGPKFGMRRYSHIIRIFPIPGLSMPG